MLINCDKFPWFLIHHYLHGITINTFYFGIEITRYLDKTTIQISNHIMATFVELKKFCQGMMSHIMIWCSVFRCVPIPAVHLISITLSVHPYTLHQSKPSASYFCNILYRLIQLKFVYPFQFCLQLYNSAGHFTCFTAHLQLSFKNIYHSKTR